MTEGEEKESESGVDGRRMMIERGGERRVQGVSDHLGTPPGAIGGVCCSKIAKPGTVDGCKQTQCFACTAAR